MHNYVTQDQSIRAFRAFCYCPVEEAQKSYTDQPIQVAGLVIPILRGRVVGSSLYVCARIGAELLRYTEHARDDAAREDDCMKVLAIGSNKGGVGKTTSALYFAARAAEILGGTHAQPAVGLVDRDESRNLTTLVRMRPEALPSGVTLLAGTEVPPRSAGFKMVIIDTPPGLSAIDSLQEANLVVIPVLPEEQGVNNFAVYLRNIDRFRIMTNPTMRLVAALPTMVETRSAMHRALLPVVERVAREHQPPLAVLPPVPRRAQIRDVDLRAPYYDEAAKELWDHAGITPVAV
jgi:cellulose biosynthesis protein BcsQ